ncbi:hypothetical protein PANO111632_02810 [Paracoccus nototheniae]
MIEKRSSGYLPPSIQTSDAHYMTEAEVQRARLDADAVKILEGCFRRTRWTAADRDAIAQRLEVIVTRELRPLGKGRRS